jgi:hypothetical protein
MTNLSFLFTLLAITEAIMSLGMTYRAKAVTYGCAAICVLGAYATCNFH